MDRCVVDSGCDLAETYRNQSHLPVVVRDVAGSKKIPETLVRIAESTTMWRLSCSSTPHSRNGPRLAMNPSAATTRWHGM